MDALDPRRDHTRTITPTTTEAVWYLSSYACHHIAGNLDLLNNLWPVSDRWVRCNESGPARQVLARGFVNCNGIILDDVWYIPGDVNLVSVSQLSGQSLLVEYSPDACIIKRNDGTVAGKAHVGPKNHFELDFMNTATRYRMSSDWESMISLYNTSSHMMTPFHGCMHAFWIAFSLTLIVDTHCF